VFAGQVGPSSASARMTRRSFRRSSFFEFLRIVAIDHEPEMKLPSPNADQRWRSGSSSQSFLVSHDAFVSFEIARRHRSPRFHSQPATPFGVKSRRAAPSTRSAFFVPVAHLNSPRRVSAAIACTISACSLTRHRCRGNRRTACPLTRIISLENLFTESICTSSSSSMRATGSRFDLLDDGIDRRLDRIERTHQPPWLRECRRGAMCFGDDADRASAPRTIASGHTGSGFAERARCG